MNTSIPSEGVTKPGELAGVLMTRTPEGFESVSAEVRDRFLRLKEAGCTGLAFNHLDTAVWQQDPEYYNNVFRRIE